MPRLRIGDHCPNSLVAALAFDRIRSHKCPFRLIAGLSNQLRSRAAFLLVAVEQTRLGGPVVNKGKFPGEVEGVLQAAVHAVSLRWRANMRRIAGQECRTGSVLTRYLGVTVKSCRILHIDERR